MPGLVEIEPLVQGKKIKFVFAISSLFPPGKVVALHLNKLEFTLPRMLRAKFG